MDETIVTQPYQVSIVLLFGWRSRLLWSKCYPNPSISTYTKLIVYFIIRLIGRLKSRLHKQSLPSETEEIQPAQAAFVCVDAVSTARSN